MKTFMMVVDKVEFTQTEPTPEIKFSLKQANLFISKTTENEEFIDLTKPSSEFVIVNRNVFYDLIRSIRESKKV